MRNSINNPFVSCTARDMSYSDVMRFWCSPYECYKINESDLIFSATPIVIEGARGSGKTMILKHLSYFCQKENYAENNALEHILEAGYLGIYFRYSADYSSLFDSLTCSNSYREFLFDNYFQLCMCVELARILKDLENEIDDVEKGKLFSSISHVCTSDIKNASEFIEWLEKNIRNQDRIIRQSQYLAIDENQEYQSKSLLFDIISVLRSSVVCLSDTMFVFIIDEYENVGDYQRIINTYMKQMDGQHKYTFRIGVRPEGIRDYSTNVAGEFLQDGRDYLKKFLAVSSDDKTANYKRFVQNVIDRRLKMVPIFKQADLSIEDLLGKKERYEWEAQYHVKGRKDHLFEVLSDKAEPEKDAIISVVSDDNPIVEAYFLMRYKRGETVKKIAEIRRDIAKGVDNENTKKYRLDMRDKYKAALLFWLIDKYRRHTAKKLYYSFATYLYLSCGSIYDFIGLCRTVFDELESNYFEQFECNPLIDPEIQTRAAQKYAMSQIEKVRINHDYGPQMHRFVQNMCSLFSYYHKGDLCTTYPETNQFYISGNFDSSGVNKEIWRSLLRWGIVIKKTSYQRASLSVNSKAQLYYINKSYYPAFGISCRIRGGFNFAVTNSVWDDMITYIVNPTVLVKPSNKKSKKAIKTTTQEPEAAIVQLNIFDMEDSDE